MRINLLQIFCHHCTFFMFPFAMYEQSALFKPIFWHSLITKEKRWGPLKRGREGGNKVSGQMPLSDHKWIFGQPLRP